MYSVHVCTTSDLDFPPPELGPGLTWDRLTEILSRDVSPDAAALFAEPIHDELRNKTNWHIASDGDPKPIKNLPDDDEQQALLAKLDALVAQILAFAARQEKAGGDINLRLAAALRTIVVVPNEWDHVWSADGRPVLTAWGRGSDAESTATIGRSVERRSKKAIADEEAVAATITGVSNKPIPQPEIKPEPSEPQPEPQVAPPPKKPLWPMALLWTLFALLILAIYARLLPACGSTMPVLSWFSDHCRYVEHQDLAPARLQLVSLHKAIANAELEVAEKRGDCAAQELRRREDQRDEAIRNGR